MLYVPSDCGVMKFSVLLPDGFVIVQVTFLPSSLIPKSFESTMKSAFECKQTPANKLRIMKQKRRTKLTTDKCMFTEVGLRVNRGFRQFEIRFRDLHLISGEQHCKLKS